MAKDTTVEKAYALAREKYAAIGVDTEKALKRLATVAISMHCWQGDDVGGFEAAGAELDGGLAATGNYPGKARTPDELRADLAAAYALIPGRHRVNVHAFYRETAGKKVERDELAPEHFARWIDWAKSHKLGMDFNPTCFSHPKAGGGYTLSSADGGIRRFWVRHCQACRRIGAHIGKALGTPAVTNIWIPDGGKDLPVDRRSPRERLVRSLNEIFGEPLNPAHNLDSIEGKLFGIGSESYVVGSHEFYLAYAVQHDKLLCLDAGHFHPTETIADKISALLVFVKEMLLHVSRGVRWDSDHVVILNDDLRATAEEIVRGDYLDRVHIGLDYFDASINRIAAWVIGMRAMLKALLAALLEPTDRLRRLEHGGDLAARLAWLEELKGFPFGAVWDAYCLRQGTPVGNLWIDAVRRYEKNVLAKRA